MVWSEVMSHLNFNPQSGVTVRGWSCVIVTLVCFLELYLHRWLQSGLFCHLDPSAPPSQQETAREHTNQMHRESLADHVTAQCICWVCYNHENKLNTSEITHRCFSTTTDLLHNNSHYDRGSKLNMVFAKSHLSDDIGGYVLYHVYVLKSCNN